MTDYQRIPLRDLGEPVEVEPMHRRRLLRLTVVTVICLSIVFVRVGWHERYRLMPEVPWHDMPHTPAEFNDNRAHMLAAAFGSDPREVRMILGDEP